MEQALQLLTLSQSETQDRTLITGTCSCFYVRKQRLSWFWMTTVKTMLQGVCLQRIYPHSEVSFIPLIFNCILKFCFDCVLLFCFLNWWLTSIEGPGDDLSLHGVTKMLQSCPVTQRSKHTTQTPLILYRQSSKS